MFGAFAALAALEHTSIVESTQATVGRSGTRSPNCAPYSVSHARRFTALSIQTVFSSRMSKSYSTGCKHDRLAFSSVEVEFNILLESTLKNNRKGQKSFRCHRYRFEVDDWANFTAPTHAGA